MTAASELVSQNGEIKADDLLTELGKKFPGLKKPLLFAIQGSAIYFTYQGESYFINSIMGGGKGGKSIVTDIASVKISLTETETSQGIFKAASDLVRSKGGRIKADELIAGLSQKFPGLKTQLLLGIQPDLITVNYGGTLYINCTMDEATLKTSEKWGITVTTANGNTIVTGITSVKERVEPDKTARTKSEGDSDKTDFGISTGIGGFFGSDFDIGLKFGGYAFLDLTYAEISFGIGSSTWKDYSTTNLDISLLGKYPFWINDNLSVFPLLGIEYDIALAHYYKGKEVKDLGDFSALWFKLGGGTDFYFTDNVFLRFGVLFGMDLSYGESGLTAKLAVGYRF
ncbi:MAG: porin family protein [Treponema sp.]|nr:porin family protein [Treponema sp.]